MEHVKETLSALIPALESHGIGSWDPKQVELLCAMLKEYGEQARASEAEKSEHPVEALDSEDETHEGKEELDEEDALFVEAVSEVDRGLELTRAFLRSRLPYGARPEPTQIPGSSTVDTATTHSSKKRPRSPDGPTEQTKATNWRTTLTSVVPAPVYAVDSFLYSEDDVEELVKENKIVREYCARCGCTDIRLSDFITHSFSRDQLLYLSCFIFPHLIRQFISVSAKTPPAKAAAEPLSIVDVGSRLGVVLWACAFALQKGALVQPLSYTDEDEEPEVHITGVEVDEAYVKLSQDVLRRFFMPRRRRAPRLDTDNNKDGVEEPMDVSSRLHLVKSDCFDGAGAETLSHASVVVLHNVFEYFCPSPVEHARCWLKLRRLVCHTGQFLVCSPALEETLDAFTVNEWAAAWAAEECGQVTAVAPLKWLSSFVERVDVSAVMSDFLALRILSRNEGDDSGEDGCCGASHEDAGHGHHHLHGERHHEHDHDQHDAREASDSGDEDSEVEEQVRKIHFYRVL